MHKIVLTLLAVFLSAAPTWANCSKESCDHEEDMNKVCLTVLPEYTDDSAEELIASGYVRILKQNSRKTVLYCIFGKNKTADNKIRVHKSGYQVTKEEFRELLKSADGSRLKPFRVVFVGSLLDELTAP